jgi:formate hydrogenlyase subunit 3/multisubunit Na+/H+ antiporter MnhD subunit
VLSLAVADLLLLTQRDLKRMLAKSSLFLTSGRIHHVEHTTRIALCAVQGRLPGRGRQPEVVAA